MSSELSHSPIRTSEPSDQVIPTTASSHPTIAPTARDAGTSTSTIVESQTILSNTEASAEALMNSVFEDVDYMLEKGVSLVPAPASAPSQQSQGLAHQNGTVESSVPSHPVEPLSEPLSIDSEHQNNPTPPPDTDQTWGRAIKITLPILGACAALGVALATGFVLHSPSSPWHRGAMANAGNTDTIEGPDTEFASYMQRALDTIASSERAGSVLGNSSNTDAGGGADNSPGLPANNSFRSSGIPQRVYIPVYQPPSPSVSPLPSVPVQESLASTPQVETNPSLPTPPAPVALAPATPSPTAPAPAPPPSPPAPPAPTTNSSEPLLSELSHDHVLVGLLQLGDRSVAMFDFSEGTHRVKVGEQIGNSGWSLVSVSQNEAVIRRNGDVRSIYIGQSF